MPLPTSPLAPAAAAPVQPSGQDGDAQASQQAPQQVVKVRRDYNSWVATETMEDYALRYTPSAFASGPNGGWPTRRSGPRHS